MYKKIPKTHYLNYLKYAYRTNKQIKKITKPSTRKRKPKNYL